MTEQQKFEVYFLASRKSKGKGRRVSFDLLPDGTYADDHTQRHWWTWQNAWQARAAQDKSAELLEALEEVVAVFESNPISITDTVWVTGNRPETLYDHARAAISKARGE